ncbi:uncharacterized protein LOC112574249 isoform X2 [Pomacea canaliculata]|uniref:uncharacterized protein LOC112574249 isoform X2 n=1 Tax=Pomacea canaliculata TaxID=400727 RepID=UPI000D73B4D8|nr:uncharacterized protein LOC112574249 isoform X2 [Pomacea canaliculata]
MHVFRENSSTDVSADFYATTISKADSADHMHQWLYYYIDTAGSVPVSLLGIVCNLVSLTVWNTQTKYSASIFLFKYLAVWDTTFLVLFIPVLLFYYKDTDSSLSITLNTLSCLPRLVSVHTTLQIAVCRWLGVYRPQQVYNGRLLPRRQVLVGCLVIFVWCLGITLYFTYFQLWVKTASFDKIYDVQVMAVSIVILSVLSLVFPILLLVVFNVLLIMKLRSTSSPVSSSFSRHQQHPGRWGSSRRLTLSVVLMSLCTVLSYLVGEIFHVSYRYWNMFQMDLRHDELVNFRNIYSAIQLLQQINSGINIVFYLAFSSKFRTALYKLVREN